MCLTKHAICATAIFKSLYRTGPHQKLLFDVMSKLSSGLFSLLLLSLPTYLSCPWVLSHIITMFHKLLPPSHSDLVYQITVVIIWHTFFWTWHADSLPRVRSQMSTWQSFGRIRSDDDDCFYYHSWRNNVVIAFGTLSSFLT